MVTQFWLLVQFYGEMMLEKEFTQEDLDRMYDKAMKWQLPAQEPTPDPRAVPQKVLGNTSKAETNENNIQNGTIKPN